MPRPVTIGPESARRCIHTRQVVHTFANERPPVPFGRQAMDMNASETRTSVAQEPIPAPLEGTHIGIGAAMSSSIAAARLTRRLPGAAQEVPPHCEHRPGPVLDRG